MLHDITQPLTPEPFDVGVVGAGCAGLCAALAAARCGARTALVTDRPVLGGNSSSELRVPPAGTGYYNPWGTETGIIHELIVEDRARNHDRVDYGHANAVWDLVLYDACRREPNLTLYLNTLIDRVTMADERTVAAVSGPQSGSACTVHLHAAVFIDASGDGSVGIGAGVPQRTGREGRAEFGEPLAPPEPDDFVLGSTLAFRARDVGVDAPFTPPDWAAVYDYPEGIPYRSTASFAGGYWWIEIGWPLDVLHGNDAVRDELARHVFGVWDHIRNRGREREKARTWVLDWVGWLPARRESRRFAGAYQLTQHDLTFDREFPDTVAYGGWSIDDHTRGGILAVDQKPSFDGVRPHDYHVNPYPVPLRCLYAEGVDNLLFAGRVMSASRVAFTSLRVQQTLATVGQAAGTAAALCARKGCRPHDLAAAPEALQQQLLRDDAWLPHVAHDHLARDTRGATATASSCAPLHVEPGQAGLPLSGEPAALLPVAEARIDAAHLYLVNPGAPARLSLSVHAASHVWDLAALERPPLVTVEAEAPSGEGWVRVDLDLPVKPRRFHWLKAAGPAEVVWRYAADDPLGTACARRWPDGTVWFAPGIWSRWRSLAVNLAPAGRPWTPDQVLTGIERPERWTNAWVSNPAEPLPQWLELDLGRPPRFGAVQVLFDTQLNRINYVTPGFFRAPECVRDYRLEAEVDGAWRTLAEVSGNYQRRREHSFQPLCAQRLRVVVTATNGGPEARVYGVRVYAE